MGVPLGDPRREDGLSAAAGTGPPAAAGGPPSRSAGIALALAAVYLIWGSSYLATKVLVADEPPLFAAGLRFLLAGLLLGAFDWWRSGPPRLSRTELRHTAVVMACTIVVSNGCNVVALQHVASNVAALLNATPALWIAWLGTFGRRATSLSRQAKAGLAVGFAGTAMVLAPGPGGSWTAALGWQALILVGCLGWSLGTVYFRNARIENTATMFLAMQMSSGGAALVLLAAALGAGAVLPTQASSIWGTAAIHQRWVTSFSPSEIGYLVSHPQQPDRWLRFVATSAGMVNLDYWRELLYPEVETGSRWMSLELALAQLPPGCDGLMYLPYLSAADERSEETPGVFGAGFLGVQAHHRRTHYLRAIYEGLAIQAARILRRLDPLDVPLQEVRVAGGGAQSDLLTQLLAHATGLRVVRPQCIEASLLGVAGVAFTALGYATDLDALMQTFNPPQATYTPDATMTSSYRKQAAAIDRLLRSLAEASPEQPESAANELA